MCAVEGIYYTPAECNPYIYDIRCYSIIHFMHSCACVCFVSGLIYTTHASNKTPYTYTHNQTYTKQNAHTLYVGAPKAQALPHRNFPTHCASTAQQAFRPLAANAAK